MRGALAASIIGFLAGAAVCYGRWHWSWTGPEFHWQERVQAIEAQAGQMPSGGVVVFGDSITEYNRFSSLCGREALNAGIAWARTSDWLPEAGAVIQRARPSIVILAVGFNDDYGDRWKADYAQLAKTTGAKFGVGTDDPRKDAFIRSLLPMVPRPSVARYGRHPNAAGAALWRDSLNRLCS